MKKVISWIPIWLFCMMISMPVDLLAKSCGHVIRAIPAQGIVIKRSGTYLLRSDLLWTPDSDGVAITIQADDVTLNMKGFTLESTSSIFKTMGIVAHGSENIKIRHGTIKNMGVSGIQCNECTHVLIKNMVVDGLYANDIVNYTVPTGILANECAFVSIDKCVVKNMNVRTGSSAAIQLTKTFSSEVIHCQVSNLLNRDGSCTGIGHLLCDEALVRSCTLDKLKSEFINNLNTEGHTAIGLVPFSTTNLEIDQCTVSNITGCCDDAHGMSIFICAGAIIKNCEVFNVLDGAGPAHRGAKATGIEVYASGVEVNRCFVKNITAINPEDKQATGFSCALCDGVAFIECKAENVSVVDEHGHRNPDLGYGIGFGWAPDPRPEFIEPAVNVLYQNCIAKNCQVGFDSFFHIDCIWDHIISKYNDISVLNEVDSQRTLSCDACSECGCLAEGCYPDPLIVTIDNVAENNFFIRVKRKIR